MSAINLEQAAPEIRTQFLDGMSRAAFCVNVVTTDGPAGRAGVTVSAMSSVSADRIGVASGINNAVARVASLLAIAVLGIVFVWSHGAALAARLDQLHIPHDLHRSGQLLEPDPAAMGGAIAQSAQLARAQAEAIDAGLRAVALVSAACALLGAACAAATIRARD